AGHPALAAPGGRSRDPGRDRRHPRPGARRGGEADGDAVSQRVGGLPVETKDRARRVALTPSAVATVVGRGHRVLVQSGAGEGAGCGDDAYKEAGAEIVTSAADVWAAEVVVKVKEPQAIEYAYFRADLTLFAYLHLAAE